MQTATEVRSRPGAAKSDHRSRAVIRCRSEWPARYFAQILSTAGLEGKINESPRHLLLGGVLDLLGLREGVFPGVVLLSRRR